MSGNRRGVAVLLVLVLTLVLFGLVSLALTANYRLHDQTRRMQRELQARADRLSARVLGVEQDLPPER